jgi:hypothetical protein
VTDQRHTSPQRYDCPLATIVKLKKLIGAVLDLPLALRTR